MKIKIQKILIIINLYKHRFQKIFFWQRLTAFFLALLILFSSSPLTVFAADKDVSDTFTFTTPELEKLADVKPGLVETHEDKREKIIDEIFDEADGWTERHVLKRMKKNNVENVLGRRKDAEKVVAELKEAGAIATVVSQVTGTEKEINPNLVRQDEYNFSTNETPYEIKVPLETIDPIIIGEDVESAGKIISAEGNKKVVEDVTPNLKEEIRYFNRDANNVVGNHEDNKIIYKNIWESVDLLVTTTTEGIKEDIILKNSTASTYFDYIVETENLILEITDDGGIVFLDRTGEEKFFTPAPDITDVYGVQVESEVYYELGWIDDEQEISVIEDGAAITAEPKRINSSGGGGGGGISIESTSSEEATSTAELEEAEINSGGGGAVEVIFEEEINEEAGVTIESTETGGQEIIDGENVENYAEISGDSESIDTDEGDNENVVNTEENGVTIDGINGFSEFESVVDGEIGTVEIFSTELNEGTTGEFGIDSESEITEGEEIFNEGLTEETELGEVNDIEIDTSENEIDIVDTESSVVEEEIDANEEVSPEQVSFMRWIYELILPTVHAEDEGETVPVDVVEEVIITEETPTITSDEEMTVEEIGEGETTGTDESADVEEMITTEETSVVMGEEEVILEEAIPVEVIPTTMGSEDDIGEEVVSGELIQATSFGEELSSVFLIDGDEVIPEALLTEPENIPLEELLSDEEIINNTEENVNSDEENLSEAQGELPGEDETISSNDEMIIDDTTGAVISDDLENSMDILDGEEDSEIVIEVIEEEEVSEVEVIELPIYGSEIEVVEEEEEEGEVEVIEKSRDKIEIKVLTEQGFFAESGSNYEEIVKIDSSIIRRYRLRLSIATAEESSNEDKLILANGTELTYPLDLDPSTFVRIIDRGSRTFAPDFSMGSQNGNYSQTNNPGVINRGTENVQPNGVRVNSATSSITVIDSSGLEFLGNTTNSSQDWVAIDTSIRSNKIGSKVNYTSGIATEIWLGLTFSPAGGIIRATIDKGTSQEIINEVDTFFESIQIEQKILLATGLRNSIHTVELELLTRKNSHTDSEDTFIENLQNGLAGWWKLNEPVLVNGSTITDFSANLNNGTTVGTMTSANSVRGAFSNAINFDGADDYVAIPDDSSLNPVKEITLSAWVRPDFDPSTGTGRILSKYNTGEYKAYSLYVYQGILGLILGDGSAPWHTVQFSGSVLQQNKFSHVVATYNQSYMKLYVDGELVNTSNEGAFDISATTQDLWIGETENYPDWSFDGVIDEVAIFNRALSGGEVSLLYESKFAFNFDYFETYSVQHELAGEGIASTADSGTTATLVDTALTQVDDYFNGYALEFTSGDHSGKTVYVTDFDATSDALLFTPAVGTAVSTETFKLTSDGIRIGDRASRGVEVGASFPEFELFGNLPMNATGKSEKGTFSIWISPNFAYDADSNQHYIFDTGLQRLYFSGNDDKFHFEIWNGSDWTTIAVSSTVQSFAAHDSIHLAVAWSAQSGVKLWINGEITNKSVSWDPQELIEANDVLVLGAKGGRSPLTINKELIGYWPLDNNFFDYSNSKNNGTASGVLFEDGHFNQAGFFDGADDYIDFGSIGSTKSVSFWIQADDLTAREIFSFDGGTHSIELNSSGEVVAVGFSSPTIYVDGVSTSVLPDTGWHFITATTSTAFTASSFTAGKTIGTNFFDGRLDDVAIYDYILTTTEIDRLYRNVKYFNGVLAEPQIWDYVLIDSEIFTILNSDAPSVGQVHTRKIEETQQTNKGLLFNAPMAGTPNDRIGSLAGSVQLDSKIIGEVSTISATDGQEPNWIEDGQVGYWKMDGNYTDSIGSNDGVWNDANTSGQSFPTGKFSNAVELDGIDDYVEVGSTGQTVKTVSCWIYADNDSRDIVDFDGGTHSIEVTSGTITATGFVSPTIYINGEIQDIESLQTGRWYYIAVTTETGFTASALKIGKETTFFGGRLDDFAIYNRTLSTTEIAQLYQKNTLEFHGDSLAQSGGMINTKNLEGYWKMDGDWKDFSGNGNDGTAVDGATFDADGRFGEAGSFDGSNDYVNIGSTEKIVNSASFWIYSDSDSEDIIDFDGGTHSIEISSGVITATGFSSPVIYVDGIEDSTFTISGWHHISIITDTGFTASALKLGKETTFFDGKLDEFAIFSRELSASEISEIYAAQKGSYITYETPEATVEIIAGLNTGSNRGIARVTVDIGTPQEIITEIDTFESVISSQQRFLVATGLDSKKHTVKIENVEVMNLSSTKNIVALKFIETTSSSTIDSSQMAINGRLIDDVIVSDYTTLPNAMQFPEKGNISESAHEGSLEFWATGSLANGDYFVDTRDTSANNGLRIYMDSADSITFEFKNASVAVSIADTNFSAGYSASTENHIFARWWRSTSTTFGMSLYLNGVKIVENVSQVFTPTSHSRIVLGNDSTPDTTADFDGSIYDFSIYANSFSDGGVAINTHVIPNSEVWDAYHSYAKEVEKIESLVIDSDTTVNATDDSTSTFFFRQGAIQQKVFDVENYIMSNQDTGIGLRVGSADNEELSQEFQVNTAGTIQTVSLLLKENGEPSGNISLEIQTDDTGLPSGAAITNGSSGSVVVDNIGTSDYKWVTFTFATAPILSTSTVYHLVLKGTYVASASNHILWGADNSTPSYSNGTSEIKDSAWAESTEDFIFRIYEKYSLMDSVDAFVNGVEVPISSVKTGTYARVNDSAGISATNGSITVDNIGDENEISSVGFLYLGNPTGNLRREKIYYSSYSSNVFSGLKRGVDGTAICSWEDNTVVEIVGVVTLVSAPEREDDLFIRYIYSGDAVARNRSQEVNQSQGSIILLDESVKASDGWSKNDPNLMGYWSFNGNYRDYSGNDNDGTWNDTNMSKQNFPNGKYREAVKLDGTDDYINFGSIGSIKSISFWLQANDTTTREIFDFDNGTHKIELNSSGEITTVGFSSPMIYVDGVQGSNISDTSWHFVSVVTETLFSTSNFIAGKTVGTNFFDGRLDDVVIYSRALFADEILRIYSERISVHTQNTSVVGQTAIVKSRGTEISAVLDQFIVDGGISQFIIDEGTANEKRVLIDSSSGDVLKKIKSLATNLNDNVLHTIRLIAGVLAGMGGDGYVTRFSAWLANGYAPILQFIASSGIVYETPVADLDPENIPDNEIEGAIGGNDVYTEFLLQSNEADNSTIFIDSSVSNHAITASGETHHETDAQKFGATSIYFDGNSDYLEVPDAVDLEFADSNFTIDFWANFSDTSDCVILHKGDTSTSNASYLFQFNTGNLEFKWSINGTTWSAGSFSQAWTPTVDQWYYMTVVRDAAALKIFVDGSQLGSSSNIGTDSIYDNTVALVLSTDSVTEAFDGYFDEIRISDTARWSADFDGELPEKEFDNVDIISFADEISQQKVNDVKTWDTTVQFEKSAIVPQIKSRVNLLTNLSDSATEVVVEYIDHLPNSGVIQINDEIIKYGAVVSDGVTAKLLQLQRGHNNTTVSAHVISSSEGIISGLSNVNDIFIYDTSKDTVNSGWRFDHTKSWYLENSSAIRCPDGFSDSGSMKCTRSFPEVAVIVATDSNLYIYEAESQKLWMSVSQTNNAALGANSNNDPAAIFALNGEIYTANNGSAATGLHLLDFIFDGIRKFNTTNDYLSNRDISNRNVAASWNTSRFAPIVNTAINDVHAAVVNGKTYIAVATDGGVSVINKEDKETIDYVVATTNKKTNRVVLTSNGELYLSTQNHATNTNYETLLAFYVLRANDTNDAVSAADFVYTDTTIPALNTLSTSESITSLAIQEDVNNTVFIGTDVGVVALNEKKGDESNGSVEYVTTDYVTEKMTGNIRGMWTFDGATRDLDQSVVVRNLSSAGNVVAAGVRNSAMLTTTSTTANVGNFATYSFGGWVKNGSVWEYFVRVSGDSVTDYKNGSVITSGFTTVLSYVSPNFIIASGETVDELFFAAESLDAATIRQMYKTGKMALESSDEQKIAGTSNAIKSVSTVGDSLFVVTDGGGIDDGVISKINLNSNSRSLMIDTDSSFAGGTIGTIDTSVASVGDAGVVFADNDELFIDAAEIYVLSNFISDNFGNWQLNQNSSWFVTAGTFPEKVYLVAREAGLDIIDAADNSLWMNFAVGAANLFNSRIKAVTHSNGAVFVGTENGVIKLDFVNDEITKFVGQQKYSAEACNGKDIVDFKDVNNGNFCFSDEAPLHSGDLVGKWSFDNISDGKIVDASNNNNSATAYGDTTFTTDGPNGRAAGFDGAGDYLDINDIGSLKSIAFWLKADDITTRELFDFDGGTHKLELNASSVIVATGFTSPAIYIDGVLTSTLPDTGWHFITVTTGTAFAASNFLIGKTTGTNFFDGRMDEIAVLDRELTITQINDLYQISLASLHAGHVTSLDISGNLIAVGTKNIESITESKTFVVNQNVAVDLEVLNSVDSDIVGEWDFEDAGATVADRSGNENTGTSSGGVTFTAGGPSGKAANFDGIDGYVEVGSTGQTVKTVSCWIYADNDSRDIVDFDGGTHSIEVTSGTITATGFVSPAIYVNGETKYLASLQTGKWQHITITTETGFTASALKIGKETTFFDGKLDDFAIYNRALSTSEILALYNSGRQILQSADAGAAVTDVHFDSSDNFYFSTDSQITKTNSSTLETIGNFLTDLTKNSADIDVGITRISALSSNLSDLFVGTNIGVEKLQITDLARVDADTFLAQSNGENNILEGTTNEVTALSYDSTEQELAVGTNDSVNGATSIINNLGSTPGLTRNFDELTLPGSDAEYIYGQGDIFGWIDLTDVIIGSDRLSGYARSEGAGWINFREGNPSAPTNCESQVSDQTASNYGVFRNPNTDFLCGYAMSEAYGWISFKGDNYEVRINDDGKLSGYALTEGMGWIYFNPTTQQEAHGFTDDRILALDWMSNYRDNSSVTWRKLLAGTRDGFNVVEISKNGLPIAPTISDCSHTTDTTVRVNWIDNSNSELGFKIERAPDDAGSPGTFTQIDTVATNITSYSDSGLAGETYYYRVRSYNLAGDSSYSRSTSIVMANYLAKPDSSIDLAYESAPTSITNTLADFMTSAFDAAGYTAVGVDDSDFESSIASATPAKYAAHLYTFKTSSYDISRITPQVIAYATADAGNGITAKLWNKTTSSWNDLSALSNTSGSMPDSFAEHSVTSSLSDYIEDDFVKVLIYSTNQSTDTVNAELQSDLAQLSIWGTYVNQKPSVTVNSVVQTTDGSGNVSVNLTVNDVDDDTVSVVVERSEDGAIWNYVGDTTLSNATNATINNYELLNITNTVVGRTVTFDWDATVNFDNTYDNEFYLRFTPEDEESNVGDTVISSSFVVDTIDPVITDNQTGDDVWRLNAGTTYDVDMSDDTISSFEYSLGTSTGVTDLKAWTVISSDVIIYETDWSIDFASAQEGRTYINVRVTDQCGNTTVIDGVFYVQKDTSTPDVIAVDAGASDIDRISLASGSWFGYSDTGDDDIVSFSWTDSDSVSDDTFYYEINTTATDTIGGTESNVTNAYVDGQNISEGTSYFHIKPQNGVDTWGTERTFEVKYDKTVPTAEATTLISPNGEEIIGGDTSYTITWNPSGFADALSGLGSTPIKIEYTTDGIEWNLIVADEANDGSYDWTTPDVTSATTRIRVTVFDLAGNSASDESDDDFTLSASDNWSVVYISEGNNQTGGIENELPVELKVRVGNGADSQEMFAGAGDVNVSFTINSTPTDPVASDQKLLNGTTGQNPTGNGTSTMTVETDADGYASVKFVLGDRAGDYEISAEFGDGEGEKSTTFVLTERETFELSFSDPSSDWNAYPGVSTNGTNAAALSMTTNAASYQIIVKPDAWPTNTETTEVIGNWNNDLGFGWDNNNAGTSGGVDTPTVFAELGLPTTVYTCAGDTCQGDVDFILDLHAVVDYLNPAGDYKDNVEVEVVNVVF